MCDGRVKNRGRGWYSGQNEAPSGLNETHLGNLYEKWAKVVNHGTQVEGADALMQLFDPLHEHVLLGAPDKLQRLSLFAYHACPFCCSFASFVCSVPFLAHTEAITAPDAIAREEFMP